MTKKMSDQAVQKINHRLEDDRQGALVYLAGPDVFLPEVIQLAGRKKELCKTYGFEGAFPMDVELEASTTLAPFDKAAAISRANENLMRQCDVVIANLTPFRGASADVGTVYEIGFMRGLGKPVFGYTNIVQDYKERVEHYNSNCMSCVDPYTRAAEIEDFGLFDNLMVEFALRHDEACIQRVAVSEGEELTDLTGFERCLKRAAKIYT